MRDRTSNPAGPAELPERPGLRERPERPGLDPVTLARVESLPSDARDRVLLIDALTGGRRDPRADSFQVEDDGRLVTVEIILPDEEDQDLHQTLIRLAADTRCLDRRGRPILQTRFFRDGRRDPRDVVVGPWDAWIAGGAPIAVDFDSGANCSPERFHILVAMAEAARRDGRFAYFLNVPAHLRLLAEVCGPTHLMPIKREMVGPRLPEVLTRRGSKPFAREEIGRDPR